MITNFEDVTKPLSEDEKKLIPILIKGFAGHGIDNPIKAPVICKMINDKKEQYGLKSNFTEERLRKISNFIRSQGILPLIATSSGYYVSYDANIISKQIRSLRDRADAILVSANGLYRFINGVKI